MLLASLAAVSVVVSLLELKRRSAKTFLLTSPVPQSNVIIHVDPRIQLDTPPTLAASVGDRIIFEFPDTDSKPFSVSAVQCTIARHDRIQTDVFASFSI